MCNERGETFVVHLASCTTLAPLKRHACMLDTNAGSAWFDTGPHEPGPGALTSSQAIIL